ncbi:MAG TPA: MFS transporter [Burkholderiales bacterium]|nr:MFS transporter [Burkholderiales bacterium]
MAANFLAVAARMSLVTFLGIYFVQKAGIDIATVGLAFLCENLARGLLAPMFGALSDRIGRRALLLVAALATAAVLPCFLLVTDPLTLVLWSLALGLTGAINMPVATALLLDLAPAERRQSVLALNYTVMSVAYTLGVSPAGYVAERGYGLLAAISAAGYLLVALLYALALRTPVAGEKRSEAGVVRDTVAAFVDRRFALFAAIAFVFPLSMGLVVTVSPLFGAERGLGEGYIGLVLGGNSIIVALLALPIAARVEPMGPFRVLGAAAAVVAAALACYGAIPHAGAALLVGTIIFSFGEIVFSSAVPAAVARLAPEGRRGAYQGSWALVGSLSMGSALILSGALSRAIGWEGTWLLFSVLVAAAAAAFFKWGQTPFFSSKTHTPR